MLNGCLIVGDEVLNAREAYSQIVAINGVEIPPKFCTFRFIFLIGWTVGWTNGWTLPPMNNTPKRQKEALKTAFLKKIHPFNV